MERTHVKTKLALAFVIAGMLAVGAAGADKPSWAGGGKSGKGEHRGKSDDRKGGHRDAEERSSRHESGSKVRAGGHFGDQHRAAVHDYYGEEFRRGHCPPGLAKKHNGCMPPGQAKKWAVGQPLPRDVIFHHVPPPLAALIGRPPSGHRYVRVASDILMITLGRGTVVDAIQNLGRI